jgi:hypothetical protein
MINEFHGRDFACASTVPYVCLGPSAACLSSADTGVRSLPSLQDWSRLPWCRHAQHDLQCYGRRCWPCVPAPFSAVIWLAC